MPRETETLKPPDKRGGLFDRNRLIPIVIAIALFMELMDSSALVLAIPTVARDLGVSPSDMRLALTAYVATVAALVPVSSWMAARLGARRVFLCAIMVFAIGSVCCGVADSLPALVGARVLQGVGGAMMIPVGRAIMIGAVDREALVKAMAWFTIPAIFGPLLGPPLAGFLIEFANWRWIFFINVPVGVLAIVAIVRFVPVVDSEPRRVFDIIGFLLCAAAILCTMALVETGALAGKPWQMRLGAVISTLSLGSLYVRHALHSASPIVDLRILHHATLRLSLAATWLQRVSMGALVFVLPLQLQIGLGISPLVAAQVPAAGAIGSIISRFSTPPLLRRFGFRPVMMMVALLIASAAMLPVLFESTTPIWLMAAFMAGYSLMRATFFMSGNALSYADVAKGSEIGHASVLFSVAQQLSLGLGYSIGGGLLAAAGGAASPSSYWIVYPVIVTIALTGGIVISFLPPRAGELLRRQAST
ncbi:MFS transporter [Sphingorhabdus sp.]|uniref:MFS transporter n=1 Tax=Sphingorhabdus sp. TaxID=1902408 RepID=UPI004053A5F3